MRRGNTSELPLREQILRQVSGDASAAAFDLNIGPEQELIDEYFNDPVGFVKNVLHEVITDDIAEVMESVRDNVITLAQSANGTGKTHGAARVIAWFYKTRKNVQVYTAAAPPEDNLKRLLWGEISSVIAKNKSLFNKDKISLSSMEVRKGELEFITGVTIPQNGDANQRKARFSGKHAPFLLFVIDEGDAIPPEIYEAIESCMSGGFARLLVLFNPRAQTGPLYAFQQKRQAVTINLSAFNHPNVITGKDIIPGAVTREVTIRRINEWTRPLIDGERIEDVFYVPDYLVGETCKKLNGDEYYPPLKPGLRKIVEPAFAYMVLGRYSAQVENQLINRQWCERAVERWKAWVFKHGEIPPIHVAPKMGLDVAEFGDDFNICTFRYGGFCARQRVWGGVDIDVTADNAALAYHEMGCSGAYVDSNGLGAGVWPKMRKKDCIAHRIMVQEGATEDAFSGEEVIGQFDRVRDQGWWKMGQWLKNDPDAMLPYDALEPGGLVDQLCAATYTKNKRGKIKVCDNDIMKARLNGKSPDNATSLMLTFCPENDDSGASEMTTTNYAY